MGESLEVSFCGVRGSTPCPCDDNRRYGGNTSCVVLDVPGGEPILFDLGTGLRLCGLGDGCPGTVNGRPFRGTALVSHLHWDHVQGLPFFGPLHYGGAHLDVYGPADPGTTLVESFDAFMNPPFFPICFRDLPGTIEFHDVVEETWSVGPARVTARSVPHVGRTFGYRVDWAGRSVAYVSDHQQPVDDSRWVAESVLELADGVDVLVHDAQFTPEEFAQRPHWGHCTVDYALEVAHQAGVGELVLFHHDPAHCDDEVDDLLALAASRAEGLDVCRVTAAAEGDSRLLAARSEPMATGPSPVGASR